VPSFTDTNGIDLDVIGVGDLCSCDRVDIAGGIISIAEQYYSPLNLESDSRILLVATARGAAYGGAGGFDLFESNVVYINV
jgi:hypothetical protein